MLNGKLKVVKIYMKYYTDIKQRIRVNEVG
jgi:hypothetical protein